MPMNIATHVDNLNLNVTESVEQIQTQQLFFLGMFGFDCIGDKKHSKDSWKDNKTINARVINMTPAYQVAA